jgi:hypothetical protein
MPANSAKIPEPGAFVHIFIGLKGLCFTKKWFIKPAVTNMRPEGSTLGNLLLYALRNNGVT